MDQEYGKLINDKWDLYHLLFDSDGNPKSGKEYNLPDGNNHCPTPAQLLADGRRLVVPTVFDQTTHKLVAGSYSIIGDEIMRQDTTDLTPDELSANLSIAKQNRCTIIGQALISAGSDPIVHATGTYPGGYEAADMRNNGRELVLRCMTKGWMPPDSSVEFYDVNGVGINLTMDESDEVVLLTALKFQSDINICQAKKVQINNAEIIQEVENISW